jgi:hypothetical protein
MGGTDIARFVKTTKYTFFVSRNVLLCAHPDRPNEIRQDSMLLNLFTLHSGITSLNPTVETEIIA